MERSRVKRWPRRNRTWSGAPTSRHGEIAASHGQLHQAEDFYEKARQVGKRVEIKSAEAGAIQKGLGPGARWESQGGH